MTQASSSRLLWLLTVTRQAVSQCELEQQPAVVMHADVQCQPAGQECVTDS